MKYINREYKFGSIERFIRSHVRLLRVRSGPISPFNSYLIHYFLSSISYLMDNPINPLNLALLARGCFCYFWIFKGYCWISNNKYHCFKKRLSIQNFKMTTFLFFAWVFLFCKTYVSPPSKGLNVNQTILLRRQLVIYPRQAV